MYELFIASKLAYLRSQELVAQAERDRLFQVAREQTPRRAPGHRRAWLARYGFGTADVGEPGS